MTSLEVAVRTVVFLAGVYIVGATLMSAIHAFVVPRAIPVRIARFVFIVVRGFFDLLNVGRSSYESKDRLMALFAPLALLALEAVWLLFVAGGCGLMFWALGSTPGEALDLSGSSLLTLGFARPDRLAARIVSFVEAGLGVGLLALLITYLPSMYAAFSRREAMVSLLAVRAGNPPSAVGMLERLQRIRFVDEDRIDDMWRAWEKWFVEVEESHSSLAALTFFRSPNPGRSWVVAAGTVLDAAALADAAIDRPASPASHLCIRSGYIALRNVCRFYGLPLAPRPPTATDSTGEISVTREEFDRALAHLAEAGVPLKADRDAAWRNFAGWRVNYDRPLLLLASLTMSPPAPWISDRGAYRRLPIRRSRTKRTHAIDPSGGRG